MNTQTQEALKMAIDDLELCNGAETVEGIIIYTHESIQACKEALAQPAQEPVAYRFKWDEHLQWHYSEYLSMRDYYDSEPLYTHPTPSWQKLSDDEIVNIVFERDGLLERILEINDGIGAI